MEQMERRLDVLEKFMNAMDDVINDLEEDVYVYVDLIQDLNNRLQVLEGAENLRTKREDTLGHLQIIGQLEEEVERLKKQRDTLLVKLEEAANKAQDIVDELKESGRSDSEANWQIGYADGVWVSYRFLCEAFEK